MKDQEQGVGRRNNDSDWYRELIEHESGFKRMRERDE